MSLSKGFTPYTVWISLYKNVETCTVKPLYNHILAHVILSSNARCCRHMIIINRFFESEFLWTENFGGIIHVWSPLPLPPWNFMAWMCMSSWLNLRVMLVVYWWYCITLILQFTNVVYSLSHSVKCTSPDVVTCTNSELIERRYCLTY